MKIPDFKDENEIAAFMEEHDGFELLDNGLAEIVETPVFKRKKDYSTLKRRKINIYCKDDTVFQKLYPHQFEQMTFVVLDIDSNGIFIRPDLPNYDEQLFIPFLNISGIKLLQGIMLSSASRCKFTDNYKSNILSERLKSTVSLQNRTNTRIHSGD